MLLNEQSEMELEETQRASISVRAGADQEYVRCFVVTEDEMDSLFTAASVTFNLITNETD
jgi:hypothetical protein